MKHFKTIPFIVLIGLIAFFSSCKKSNDSPPAPKNVQGLWIGTASNANTTSPYSLSINPGGKVTFEWSSSGQEQFGAGTWTLVGSDFTATLTTLYGFPSNVGVQQTLTAKFDSKAGTLSDGKYKNASPSTESGTFAVTKVE